MPAAPTSQRGGRAATPRSRRGELLDALQAIEQRHGRERPYRNAPRTLDLDLLLLRRCATASRALTLPHPRMHERAFVLVPLAELAPELRGADAAAWPLLGTSASSACD